MDFKLVAECYEIMSEIHFKPLNECLEEYNLVL